MPAISAVPSFQPARVNGYVPNMKYAADHRTDGVVRVSLGSPALAVATAILNVQSINVAVTFTAFGGSTTSGAYTFDATYGRNVTLVLSGAGTPTVIIKGRDWMGQPMQETLTGNGTSPVVGLKIFKYIDSVASTLVAATTLSMGPGGSLGLPWKTVKVISDERAGVPQTLGTLTNPVLTDPATATTGDPRGSYVTNAALAGNEVTLALLCDDTANASSNGGLLGIRHFFS